ncbi:hypothetical protein Enr10x_26660 [Gimesia panareensis]|uniref:Uncharacterized protein n=1 Tax=Gimesia panareensis TaxID=2527978 RepID=A0A517Q6U3_9PLAN|nr:hypothetical protein [Gimesia panareensis]QDT27349.1 hypothetical protein Enr10x_26660 [Gimesia panareensis]
MDELRPDHEVWHLKWLPPIRKRWAGNFEAVIALFCLYWLLFVPDAHGLFPPLKFYRFNSPWRREVPWFKFIVWGLGIGFSVGAIRFGNLFCRGLGILSLAILLLYLLEVVS